MDRVKKKDSLKTFAAFLIWLGVIGIFLWALARSFGWIHSSTWIEMIPYFFGASSFGGICIYCGKVLNRLDRVEKDVKKIDDKVDAIINDTSVIKATISAQDKQIGGLERDVYNNPRQEKN